MIQKYLVHKTPAVAMLVLLVALMLSCTIILSPVIAYADTGRSFTDVKQTDWFYTPVTELAGLGAINGYADGEFRPGASITRAEFAKMVVAALGEKPSAAKPAFSDVASSSWAAGHIQRAKELGLIGGYNDGTFQPNSRISRQEIAAIIAHAAGNRPITLMAPIFSDASESLWSWPYIVTAVNMSAMRGYGDGTFRPLAFATRAEAAKAASALLVRAF